MDSVLREDGWTRSTARVLAAAAVLGFAALGVLLGVSEHRARIATLPGRAAAAHRLTTRLIEVNAASEAELTLLPRIGPTCAAAIIEDRERNGPFRSIDDLRRVRGIGPRTIEGLRGFARVSGE